MCASLGLGIGEWVDIRQKLEAYTMREYLHDMGNVTPLGRRVCAFSMSNYKMQRR